MGTLWFITRHMGAIWNHLPLVQVLQRGWPLELLNLLRLGPDSERFHISRRYLKKRLKTEENRKYQKYPIGFERFETTKPIIHIMPANIYTDSVGSQPFPICWWFEIASGKITMYVQNHHWITIKSPLNHHSSPEMSINIHWKSTKIHEISTTIPWTSTKIHENPIENPLIPPKNQL